MVKHHPPHCPERTFLPASKIQKQFVVNNKTNASQLFKALQLPNTQQHTGYKLLISSQMFLSDTSRNILALNRLFPKQTDEGHGMLLSVCSGAEKSTCMLAPAPGHLLFLVPTSRQDTPSLLCSARSSAPGWSPDPAPGRKMRQAEGRQHRTSWAPSKPRLSRQVWPQATTLEAYGLVLIPKVYLLRTVIQ